MEEKGNLLTCSIYLYTAHKSYIKQAILYWIYLYIERERDVQQLAYNIKRVYNEKKNKFTIYIIS